MDLEIVDRQHGPRRIAAMLVAAGIGAVRIQADLRRIVEP